MFISRRFSTYFLIILGLIIGACQSEADELLPTPMPTEAFLPGVIPEPSERISHEEYKAKLEVGVGELGPICVNYYALEVLEYGDDNLSREDYLARSVLIINGEVWPGSKEPYIWWDYLGEALSTENPETGRSEPIKGNATGPFTFCWDVELEPGMHTVEFKTRKTSGEELSYRWSFLITE